MTEATTTEAAKMAVVPTLEAFAAGRITREAAAENLAVGIKRQEDIDTFLNNPQRAIDQYMNVCQNINRNLRHLAELIVEEKLRNKH